MATLIENESGQASTEPEVTPDRARRRRRTPNYPNTNIQSTLDELTEATADYLHLLDMAKAARWRQRALIHRAILVDDVTQAAVTRVVDMTREHVHRIVSIVGERHEHRETYLGDRDLYRALRRSPAYRAAARAADRIAITTDDRSAAEARRHDYDHDLDPVFADAPESTTHGAA